MPAEEPGTGFWPDWLTPRRAAEFIRNVIHLESSVKQIQEDNRELRSNIVQLQKQLTEQNAKLLVLVDFVKQTLVERIDTRAELTVRRILDRRSDESLD
jgi:hypothetical protein